MSSTFRSVHSFCDRNILSCSIVLEAISFAKCLEFFMWCNVLPMIGPRRSASDFDTLYHIDPV